DGDLAEWSDVDPMMELTRESQVKVGGKHWKDPGQLSGQIKVMLDGKMLYVAADVVQKGPANNDVRGEKGFLKDCVELFVEWVDLGKATSDFDALVPASVRKASGYEYHLLLNPGSNEDSPHIWFATKNTGMGRLEIARIRGTNGEEAKGGRISAKNKPFGKGYVLEAAIPLENFGRATMEPGMQVGLDAALNTAADGDRLQMVYYAGEDASLHPAQWGRAFIHKQVAKKKILLNTTIKINADVAQSFNGQGEIVRETFGMEPCFWFNKHQGRVWETDGNSFGRQYLIFGNIARFPDLEGKTEEEKRRTLLNPQYWADLDMSKVTPRWNRWQSLAKLKPSNVQVMIFMAPSQIEAEPVFGTRPPKLTARQKEILNGATDKGHPGQINTLLGRVGSNDRNDFFPVDKDLYAEMCVNMLAKIKALFPEETRFSVIVNNEVNWFSMIWNKAIMDDVFDSIETTGGYHAGEIAAKEIVKLYNPIYKAIKNRFPEVLVGGPDIAHVEFVKEADGRVQWRDFTKTFLDGVEGIDFFDYHYGVNAKRAQIVAEVASQYMQQTRGKSIPSCDSEAGYFCFHMTPDKLEQYRIGLMDTKEWFGWLRNPDLTFGRAALALKTHFDGFGQARAQAMPFVMFRDLRGKYVLSESDTEDVQTVASIEDNRIASVTLNNRAEFRQTRYLIDTPEDVSIEKLEAQILWFDFKTRKIQHATFEPEAVEKAGSLEVNVELPPFGICSLVAYTDKTVLPGRTVASKRYSSDKIVFWVKPGEEQTVTVKLPSELLERQGNRYVLKIGHEGVKGTSAQFRINDTLGLNLPAHVKSDYFDQLGLNEFEIDPAVLKEENHIMFRVIEGGCEYAVLMVSLTAMDEAPEFSASPEAVVTLDRASGRCTITEEESNTLPQWYLEKAAHESEGLPPIRVSWDFDTDGSGKLVNGAVLIDEGCKGRALKLDGNGAHMSVKKASALNIGKDEDFSISLWVRLDEGTSGGILMNRGTSDDGLTLWAKTGGYGYKYPHPFARFEMHSVSSHLGNISTARGKTKLDDGSWHHIAVVRDADEEVTSIYVDGEYDGSGPGLLFGDLVNQSPLLFGIGAASQKDSLEGCIDEVRIYNGILTPGQVKSLYGEFISE
ncbi:MAG: LamG-like jellyroll fold domain-containing protein, partial [Verrucomicrobiota bacterium]